MVKCEYCGDKEAIYAINRAYTAKSRPWKYKIERLCGSCSRELVRSGEYDIRGTKSLVIGRKVPQYLKDVE